MEAFYTSLTMVSAGVSFAFSLVYLAIALKKRYKSYRLWVDGPPTGFILNDIPLYPRHILFKRLFIFAYKAWFILAYSGYPKNISEPHGSYAKYSITESNPLFNHNHFT